MPYTYTRTATTFTAGEQAPSAVEVFEGAPIVNHFGSIALSNFEVDPNSYASSIELDLTVEPPILRLKGVLALAQFGGVSPDGEFAKNTFSPNQMLQRVSGDYSGPGSNLSLT
ncbi:MAG: hypothetical protein ACOH18_03145 [Candidatus Saccharimonadaceae bacterium]